MVIVVHAWWWYWGTSAKITDHMSVLVSRSGVAQWPRSYIDERISTRIRPEGGRTGAVHSKFNGTNPRTGYWTSPGRLLP